jgi:uncharacterized protein YjiK
MGGKSIVGKESKMRETRGKGMLGGALMVQMLAVVVILAVVLMLAATLREATAPQEAAAQEKASSAKGPAAREKPSSAKTPKGKATIAFPCKYIGNIDRDRFNEPSGIVYHEERGTIFMVGDEGHIGEIKRGGKYVKKKHLRHADFEGITVQPATGLLYVAIEGEEKVLEVDPESFSVRREFKIDRSCKGKELLKPGGQGIEAITFVPRKGHPEGGTFYICNQSFSLKEGDEPSVVCEVELPIVTSKAKEGTGKILRFFSLGLIDLSGIHYDRPSGHLLIISDSPNVFLEVTLEGEILQEYAFPGDNQEGLALDGKGYLYIAQDSGGILKMADLRKGRETKAVKK